LDKTKDTLTKNSRIVEVCNKIIKKQEISNEDYQDAQITIKELAAKSDPQSRWELSQLIGFLVDDKFTESTRYIDEIADVKRVSLGDKAYFKMQRGTVTALWQARGSTARRSMVGTKYSAMEADEISCAPAIELEQLENGQIDFTDLVNDAYIAMEYALIKQIETVVEAYWDDLGSPWYASGNGVTPAIDDLITAVSRLGSPVVLGDIALIQKFVNLSGFNSVIPDDIVTRFHETGIIGSYRGAKLMQLNNPLYTDSDMTTTWLDKGYAYILPAGADRTKRPLKVVFEGDISTINNTLVQSRILEIDMYKKVGIGLASIRYGMSFFEDTSL
jgi:hypothetical protein